MTTSRELARERSGGHCEAMVMIRGIYTRCGKTNIDCHHRVRRPHGGKLLDAELEIYHLVCLCRQHHNWVHNHVEAATDLGFFLDGSVDRNGTIIVYTGTDEYLTNIYGKDANYGIRGIGQPW